MTDNKILYVLCYLLLKISITCSISLSPRPDTVTTRISSLFISLASFSTNAIACELSNAGMIPSVLVSNCKAFSASSSVAYPYLTRPIS